MNLFPNIPKPHVHSLLYGSIPSYTPVVFKCLPSVRSGFYPNLITHYMELIGQFTAIRTLNFIHQIDTAPTWAAGKPVTPRIATSHPVCRLILISFNGGLDFDNMMSGRRIQFTCFPETLRMSRRRLKGRQRAATPEVQLIYISSRSTNHNELTCSQ